MQCRFIFPWPSRPPSTRAAWRRRRGEELICFPIEVDTRRAFKARYNGHFTGAQPCCRVFESRPPSPPPPPHHPPITSPLSCVPACQRIAGIGVTVEQRAAAAVTGGGDIHSSSCFRLCCYTSAGPGPDDRMREVGGVFYGCSTAYLPGRGERTAAPSPRQPSPLLNCR